MSEKDSNINEETSVDGSGDSFKPDSDGKKFSLKKNSNADTQVQERYRSVADPDIMGLADEDGYSEHEVSPESDFAVNTGYDGAKAQRELRDPVPAQDTKKSTGSKGSAKKKKKKKKKRHSRVPGILILTVFIFAVSICLSMVIIAFGKDMLGIGKSESTKLVVIPEGANTEEISLMLKDEGVIKSPEFFQLFSRLRKSDSLYIPGEHFVRPNMAYETIIDELTSIKEEKQETVEVTFPEGTTLYDAAQILQEEGVCTAEDFIFNFNAGGFGFDFESRLPTDTTLKFWRMEGYLFPDTYFFYQNMDPEQVCQKIYFNFDSKMTPERYAKMEQLGLSLDQLVTFASIVQKEASNTDTMTMVASVFWNRLRNPESVAGKLQSDPTKNYVENVIRKNMDVTEISSSKAIMDAYDTYESTGLPPGAICNPGIEAIDAVLEDFKSDYFYFIANINTGQTYFAETLEEHEENQAKVEQQYADEALEAEEEGNE